MNPWYKEYSEFLSEIFPGKKVQKISVNAGCGCPNRDGTISRGGCIYCDNSSFSPAYTQSGNGDISSQLEAGKQFFARKYPEMKYLAYFQNYSGTYGNRSHLLKLYSEALNTEGVEGIVIGTRPDCVDLQLLKEIGNIAEGRPVIMEYGAETSHNDTLTLINRHHTWEDVIKAVDSTVEAGLHCGLHLINFLPGEGEEEIMTTLQRATSLPVGSLKFHQLQVIKGTPLHRMTESGEITLPPLELDRYLDLCVEIIKAMPENICIERFLSQSPPGMVVSPRWNLKNYQFTHLLHRRLEEVDIPKIKKISHE